MNKNSQIENTDHKKSTGDLVFEILGWLQIFASPFLLSLIVAVFIYLNNGESAISILVIALGCFVGIIWATKVWKTKGTMHYVSRISASPEFHDLKKDDATLSKRDE